MRKFLAVAAVAALALAVAVPAMALDFKFGGEYRVRFYTGTNVGFQDNPGTFAVPGDFRGVQLRVRPRFDVSDDNQNITATLRLEIGDTEFGNGGGAHGVTTGPGDGGVNYLTPGGSRVGNGSGGSIGNDGVNVETKWAYIDAAFPFGIPLRARAGLQAWYLPKGILVDDDAAGVRLYGTSGQVSYELSWFRASGGPTSQNGTALLCVAAGTNAVTLIPVPANSSNASVSCPAGTTAQRVVTGTNGIKSWTMQGNLGDPAFDNNNDYYQARVDFAAAKWLNAGVYGIYGRNAATTGTGAGMDGGGPVKTTTFFGLTTAGDLDFMKYDLDFVFGRADGTVSGNKGFDTEGFVIDGSVHVPIGPVVLNLGGSYASGDKQNGGKSEAMPFISPGWNGAGNGVFNEIFGSGGAFDAVEYSQDFPAGTWELAASLEYRPVKALWLRAAYSYISFTQSSANCAFLKTATTNCFGPIYPQLAGKTSLGNEINLRADWDVWTGFKVQGELGWLIPSSGKTAGEYILQLLYNF